MSYVGKIGVGIITSGREEMFKKCFDFHHHNVDHIVVINDGDGDLEPWCKSNFLQLDIGESANTTLKVIQHSANLGVAASKNEALEYLYDKECDHIFLMEQDMYIKNQYIFNVIIFVVII